MLDTQQRLHVSDRVDLKPATSHLIGVLEQLSTHGTRQPTPLTSVNLTNDHPREELAEVCPVVAIDVEIERTITHARRGCLKESECAIASNDDRDVIVLRAGTALDHVIMKLFACE